MYPEAFFALNTTVVQEVLAYSRVFHKTCLLYRANSDVLGKQGKTGPTAELVAVGSASFRVCTTSALIRGPAKAEGTMAAAASDPSNGVLQAPLLSSRFYDQYISIEHFGRQYCRLTICVESDFKGVVNPSAILLEGSW